MTPAGYRHVLHRSTLYQHCRGHDPFLLQTYAARFPYAVWCPVCEHTVEGPDVEHTVSDWNDHCIARLSAGKG